MSLKNLKLSDDISLSYKKELTPFEQKRAAATTYEELVKLGYEKDMEFPETWAKHVLDVRQERD